MHVSGGGGAPSICGVVVDSDCMRGDLCGRPGLELVERPLLDTLSPTLTFCINPRNNSVVVVDVVVVHLLHCYKKCLANLWLPIQSKGYAYKAETSAQPKKLIFLNCYLRFIFVLGANSDTLSAANRMKA